MDTHGVSVVNGNGNYFVCFFFYMLGYLRAANVRQVRRFVEMCKLFRSTRFNETPQLVSDLLNIQKSIIKCTNIVVNTIVMSLRKVGKISRVMIPICIQHIINYVK